jgi:deoxyribose-phosphate aldolase
MSDLARFIEHTLLKADATRAEITQLCEEARQHGFAGVCVNGANVPLAAALLAGTKTQLVAVVGFPLGAGSTASKAFETRDAVREGATEIDMVINLGALKSREFQTVQDDIAHVVAAASPAPVKVIIETSRLTEEEKVTACRLAVNAGAAYVKTSTGFNGGGATAEDVALMRATVGPTVGVKASGGVRTAADARRMIAAGATRLGTSASVSIVTSE